MRVLSLFENKYFLMGHACPCPYKDNGLTIVMQNSNLFFPEWGERNWFIECSFLSPDVIEPPISIVFLT